MVHALQEIRRLLRRDGCLIEIHPGVGAPAVEVRRGAQLLFSEHDPGYDYEDDLLSAEDAIRRVTDSGAFAIERSDEFDLCIYSLSVAVLRDHFAVSGAYDPEPKEETLATLQDELYARVAEVMATSGEDAKVVYDQKGRMTRLRPRMLEPSTN